MHSLRGGVQGGSAVNPLYWHLHHDELFEEVIGSIEERVAYIRSNKPARQVETRLRLMKPVRFDTPKLREAFAKWMEADAKWTEAAAKWKEAGAKWTEADAKWKEAGAKWKEAGAKWMEADAKWKEAVASDHARQCPDCPWDGKTIFPEAKR